MRATGTFRTTPRSAAGCGASAAAATSAVIGSGFPRPCYERTAASRDGPRPCARRLGLPRVSLRTRPELAAGAARGAVAGTGARENRAAGRAEPERNRDRGEPAVARVAGPFPAPPSELVCGGGRLRAAPVAPPAARALGWRGPRDRSRPPTLAEPGVGPVWAVVLGHGTGVDADHRTTISRCESSCPPHRGLRLPLLRSERRRGLGRGGALQ